jgi:acid ceramidase
MTLRTLAAVAHAAVYAAATCHDFEANCCHIRPDTDPSYDTFKGDPSHMVPGWEIVDLDVPPEQRWQHVIQPAAAGIQNMLGMFKDMAGLVSKEIFALIEDSATYKKLTQEVLADLGDYGLEMRGVANASGLPVEDILFYNMMYEIEGGCTSMVVQTSEGKVFHGRNLDFGLLFGIDWSKLQWSLTEALRPILRNVRFVRGNKVLYDSTVFLGYIGAFSGVKRGSFSLTINTRYDSSKWAALIAYLKGTDRSGHFLTLTARDLLESADTYDQALASIQATKILGPAYVILAGTKAGEGAMVARGANEIVNQTLLGDAAKIGQNFIVQTNWDYGKDPIYDNRRSPAEHCLEDHYSQTIDFKGVFTVLSARPNRNRLTTHTVLMSPETGDLESYIQFCNETECAPWMSEVVV